ncbi:signal peptide peptidase SppA [Robertkochia solimangrovi]|uniref:signal peptide peptidase SppA n=1 Tax=Robertkochia solimangrovi TaxID=2213046 RepID=UPI00117CB9BC|nr:signal peptide peptidase SppA [Robertkochia solimangrovi]TRZ44445.1 signal peptide peptidase SppA [Robertkochia solimangrovi]
MKFLRNLLASILGSMIAFGIMFMFLLILVALAGSTDAVKPVSKNTVLQIAFDMPVNDYGGKFRYTDLQYEFEGYNGLNNILRAIEKAKTDTNIKGISIQSTLLSTGAASVRAIRNALSDFKESGKFVYAYGDLFLQKNYYLASVADTIFLNPKGEMDFRGLSSEVLFYKDLQEKTGVKMEVIRHGKYKSAVEPYLNQNMSKENREQITELLESVWGTYLTDISENRGISVEKLDGFADELAARTPALALENNFVDVLGYFDEYAEMIRKKVGLSSTEDLNFISIRDYSEVVARTARSGGSNRIAVVYAQGEIGYGKGSESYIGQEIMHKALKNAREDDRVKAVVVRINSPGGIALTSDIIWREMEITKKEKPLIVSMGDYAASGGYYMAAAGQHIFAEPNTITGSIGVFATIPNVSELAEKWGINAEQVNTNKNSTAYSLFEPADESFKEFLKEQIEEFYQDFITLVANARGMEVAAVDSIAQGRVWTGNQAKANGLVDEIGGLKDAIAYAASEAGVSDYTVNDYPVYETSLEELLKGLSGFGFMESREDLIKEELGEEFYGLMQRVKTAVSQRGLQARMPFEINIK